MNDDIQYQYSKIEDLGDDDYLVQGDIQSSTEWIMMERLLEDIEVEERSPVNVMLQEREKQY